MGKFYLSEAQKNSFTERVPYQLTEEEAKAAIDNNIGRLQEMGYKTFQKEGDYLMARMGEGDQTLIGDMRISFYHVPTCTITVMA
eukprot:CAMPEP_0170553668 /NCGR_PEP_ID=MMETSP0211-20121228/11507_1 /TAXON_ID=311385 /ORGANISM="Pseudokeronopsis sp., Strain OXSARD2" /LENGTH=84 /DNA_ID=CAMNT_0010862157 /DNA_START=519 /DNA_END=773 /DNA_ORIENTATION=+